MPVTITIFDTYGRIMHVAEAPSSNHKVSTESYPAGVYLISVLSNGNVIRTEKIVKK